MFKKRVLSVLVVLTMLFSLVSSSMALEVEAEESGNISTASSEIVNGDSLQPGDIIKIPFKNEDSVMKKYRNVQTQLVCTDYDDMYKMHHNRDIEKFNGYDFADKSGYIDFQVLMPNTNVDWNDTSALFVCSKDSISKTIFVDPKKVKYYADEDTFFRVSNKGQSSESIDTNENNLYSDKRATANTYQGSALDLKCTEIFNDMATVAQNAIKPVNINDIEWTGRSPYSDQNYDSLKLDNKYVFAPSAQEVDQNFDKNPQAVDGSVIWTGRLADSSYGGRQYWLRSNSTWVGSQKGSRQAFTVGCDGGTETISDIMYMGCLRPFCNILKSASFQKIADHTYVLVDPAKPVDPNYDQTKSTGTMTFYSKVTYDLAATEELTPLEQKIYDAIIKKLKPLTYLEANDYTDTCVDVSLEDIGLSFENNRLYYTDVGIEPEDNGADMPNAVTQKYGLFRASMINQKIVEEHPDIMYWIKSMGYIAPNESTDMGILNVTDAFKSGPKFDKTLDANGNVKGYYVEVTSGIRFDFGAKSEYANPSGNHIGGIGYTNLDKTKMISVEDWNKIKANAQKIVNAAKDMPDDKKIEYYATALRNNVGYGTDVMYPNEDVSSMTTALIKDPDDENTPKKHVSCMGYSEAFQYLCNMTKFKSSKVKSFVGQGTVKNSTRAGEGTKHMWNVVRMNDGKSYVVDVTHNLVLLPQSGGSVREGYKVKVSDDFDLVYSGFEVNDDSSSDDSIQFNYKDTKREGYTRERKILDDLSQSIPENILAVSNSDYISAFGVRVDDANKNVEVLTKNTKSLKPTLDAENNIKMKNVKFVVEDPTLASVSVNTTTNTASVKGLKYGTTKIKASVDIAGTTYSDEFNLKVDFYDTASYKPESDSHKAIYWTVDNNIATGFDKEYWGPNLNITRSDFAIMLYRHAGKAWDDSYAQDVFSDNTYKPESDKFRAIQWAKTTGLSNGYAVSGSTNKIFKPKQNITRNEIVIMLYRYAKYLNKLQDVDLSTVEVFNDIKSFKPDSDKYKSILWCAALGISKGYDGGLFKPANPCTRKEFAIFLYRYSLKAE